MQEIIFKLQEGVQHGVVRERKDIFHIDHTHASHLIGKLGIGRPNSQVYVTYGLTKQDTWLARVGETGETFATRWKRDHEQSSWYARIIHETQTHAVFYNSIRDITPWSTDFRLALEEKLTTRFKENGFETENATRKQEKVSAALPIEEQEELERILDDIFTALPTIGAWLSQTTTLTKVPNVANVNLLSHKPTTDENLVFIEGGKYFCEIGWRQGQERSRVEGIYRDSKIVLTSLTNAPYKADWTQAGLDPRRLSKNISNLYEEIQKTAAHNLKGNGYDWRGEIPTLYRTNGLHLACGNPSANIWKLQ